MKFRRRNHEFEKATRLLDQGRAREALVIAENFLKKEDEGSQISGYLCRGMIYEDGGYGVEQDFYKAMDSYRRVSLAAPCGPAFINLARVSMKCPGGYPQARHFLDVALSYGLTSEVALCLAHYYETKPDPELAFAKECYVKAAFLWRFAGFFGYSRVARQMGQWGRALCVDILRLILGPILALLIGAKAQYRF